MLLDVLLHAPVGIVNSSYLLCYLLSLLIQGTSVLLLLSHSLILPLSLLSRNTRLLVSRHLPEHCSLLPLQLLFLIDCVEVQIRFILFFCFFWMVVWLLNGRSRKSIRRAIIVIDCTSSPDLQPILSEVEDRNQLISLHFRLAANISILLIEDSLSVPSVRHSIINNQSKYRHLSIISIGQQEISTDNFSHCSRAFLAVLEYSLAKGRPV